MAESRRRGPLRGVAAALAVTLGLAVAPGRAAADTISAESVLIDQSTLVINQQSNAYAFTAPGPGTLSVDLGDLTWPTALQSLSFSVDSAQQVLGWVSSAGNLTLQVAKGGTYYADVTGQAGGLLDLGLYSLQVEFCPATPVPLPAAIVLMLCGLGALAGVGLVRMRNESVTYAA